MTYVQKQVDRLVLRTNPRTGGTAVPHCSVPADDYGCDWISLAGDAIVMVRAGQSLEMCVWICQAGLVFGGDGVRFLSYADVEGVVVSAKAALPSVVVESSKSVVEFGFPDGGAGSFGRFVRHAAARAKSGG